MSALDVHGRDSRHLMTGSTGRGEVWFAGRHPLASARVRLFCFPYAGLGASVYRSWIGALGPDVDVLPVQLPGRETRHNDPPFRRMNAAADALADALAPFLDVPFALFGHSMGALLAFETSCRLGHHPRLRRLLVSARRAPHLADPLPPISQLPKAEFVRAVQQRYGGIPDAVLEVPELLDLLLPRLQADFELLDTYQCSAPPALACGISVFGGSNDTTVNRAELEAWQVHTAVGTQVRIVEGGHLFLQSQRESLVAAVATDLGLSLETSGVPS
jgi:surfactin synthase thioesterase subunit